MNGYWLGAVALAVAMFTATACGDSESDKVVGVVLKCDRATTRTSEPDCNEKFSGLGPKFDGRYKWGNRRLDVTVRSPDGKTYSVELPPESTVRVGDKWPPK